MANTLPQVEPDYGTAFTAQPFSLPAAELGHLPTTMAPTPVHIRAWVRYPAISRPIHGHAPAWTSRAGYIERDHRGTRRAWVWASAVEHDTPPVKLTSADTP